MLCWGEERKTTSCSILQFDYNGLDYWVLVCFSKFHSIRNGTQSCTLYFRREDGGTLLIINSWQHLIKLGWSQNLAWLVLVNSWMGSFNYWMFENSKARRLDWKVEKTFQKIRTSSFLTCTGNWSFHKQINLRVSLFNRGNNIYTG